MSKKTLILYKRRLSECWQLTWSCNWVQWNRMFCLLSWILIIKDSVAQQPPKKPYLLGNGQYWSNTLLINMHYQCLMMVTKYQHWSWGVSPTEKQCNKYNKYWFPTVTNKLEHPPVSFGRIWASSFGEEELCGQPDTHTYIQTDIQTCDSDDYSPALAKAKLG